MKILVIDDDVSIMSLIKAEMLARELPQVECIPIESAPKIPDESRLYGHTFDIVASEPIDFDDYLPEPKKGIAEKAKWASKPHKRKRKGK
jgi:hypothetical protein